ncbi:two component regulator with propeller domain [Marinilabilia salmonicolor]|uniref:hybrid sensor histidine kinase/response regulator transcription factor n=1 Tax=Marinilabilia salmonicolor TaxID=989 RepID=UPI000D082C4A|nr:hybrid sensor histidine kinase/response regulator transcription factor [Marinilabilia salmonicolor]PRY97329.1 two component regulator with propeller domain [Marinilabilia salmonicolor]
MIYFKILILFILSLLVFKPTASGNNFKFVNYQVNNGLSENTVQCIIQDDRGFLWFGTKDGLNRFDGSEFKIYKHEPGNTQSLGNNFIRSLFQDTDGRIWVGTDNQLYILNPITEVFEPFTLQTRDGQFINSAVTSIVSENKNKIWIGTMTQGAFCYNKTTGLLTQYTQGKSPQSIGSNLVWNIYRDNAGTIWIGTRSGLSAFNKETSTFVTYGSREEKSPFEDPEILSIFEDSDGELWLGTWSGGLVRFNRTTNEFTTWFNSNATKYITHIRAIFEYQKDELLVGSDDGLYLFNKKTLRFTRVDDPADPYSLSDQNVYSIYKDREEGIWVGTYFGGVGYISTNSKIIEHYYPKSHKNTLSGKAVSQFCEDEKGNLWIATEDGGLNYFNTKTRQFTSYLPKTDQNSISYHNIHALIIDGNNLWIGTFSRGLDVMNLETGTFKNYQYQENDSNTINDNCIFSLYKSKAGEIYIGTPFGLSRYNKSLDNFTRIPEINGFVYDMTEDHLGNFWIACYGEGVFKRKANSEKWINYLHDHKDSTSLCFNKISAVYQDEQHRLWFSSEGGGICKYNYETDNFRTIDQSSGLPNNVAYGVVDDIQGNIWVSTNKGISRINPTLGEVKNYTQEDGLQSNQFNYKSVFKASDGKFYFGGINGFNTFYPGQLKENQYIPPVWITEFSLLDTNNATASDSSLIPGPSKNKITLKHNQASFRINFVNLSFQARSKNQNAYILENLNQRWITTSRQNQATYINLPPGNYAFKVKGANNDGRWNQTGDSLSIEILPPLWKTNYAYAGYLFLSFGFIFLLVKNYLRITHAKQEKKIEEFKLRKEKETYLSKINFFTNIAHEIRTPISLIKAPLECIKTPGISPQETEENIQVIDKNADRLLNLVNQLLDFRKIEEDSYNPAFEPVTFNSLIPELCYRFKPAAMQKKIVITPVIPKEPFICNADREALTKIISNLMTNALKYARQKIEISLRQVDGCFEISVSDDGPGIDDKYRERIFDPFFQIEGTNKDDKKYGTGIGLAFSRQLAEKHNGRLFLDNSNLSGARFILRISTHLQRTSLEKEENKILTPPTIQPETTAPEITKRDHGSKQTLLIVEDNEDLCNFLERNLKVEYMVKTASNGKEAINFLERNSVDIIISDIVMPEVDGMELVRKTRENEQFSHIPIILLSARNNVESKIEGLDVGADSYIEKPFSFEYLKAQVNSLLRNRERLLEKFANSPFIPYGSIANNKKDEEFLNRLNKEIENNMTNPDYTIEQLTNTLSMSRSNLQRKIKGISGMTPNDYIRVFKLKKAARLIIEGKYRINEICYLAGFNNPSYFSKCFQKQFGKLPSEFMKEEQL